MRIDKLIDRITKLLFPSSLILEIMKGQISIRFYIFAFFIALKKKYLLQKKWSFQWICNKEKLYHYDISKNSFEHKTKKNGITAMWRFKNSSDFLDVSIKSILPYIDEVIMLVDISSTDNTQNICKVLAKEYWEKCKLYLYNQDVYPGNHVKYRSDEDNSIHSLSYFYNYCMSKASFNHVMKFDDDMLCVGEDFWIICDWIRKNNLTYYLDIPQINISRDNWGNLAVATKYLSSWIAGVFWDHGIFPLSEKTYFFNDSGCENLITPYRIKYSNKVGFLHLKNLKQWWGMKNYSWYGVDYIKQLNEWTNYITLPQKYKNILSKRGIE